MQSSLYDLSPLVRLLVVGVLVASGPLLWVALRHRRAQPLGRLHALTVVTLFLTFDLVLFGAFTRLTDSGLGCPDWPGCYGSASPWGSTAQIDAAAQSMPSGPVTPFKAWVEMVHRYLAMAVGVLITVLGVTSWILSRRSVPTPGALSPWWPTLTWIWVCVQGAFGALTVTMKLFPAIVTLHLLGGYVLLALLTVQVLWGRVQPASMDIALLGTSSDGPGVPRFALAFCLVLLLLQSASGAWVSTNYAVLACDTFPKCQGSWWPSMDFAAGFELWRPLGIGKDGEHVSFAALTAIHVAHRLLAMVTLAALTMLAWRARSHALLRKPAHLLLGLLVLQLGTGLSNVILDWPIVAAVIHTGGAGAMVVVLVWKMVLVGQASRRWTTRAPQAGPTHKLEQLA